jgi:hypothetical protein
MLKADIIYLKGDVVDTMSLNEEISESKLARAQCTQ